MGTPYIFEDYWLAHPEPALVVRPSYHLGYSPFEANPLAGSFDAGVVDNLGAKEIRAMPRLANPDPNPNPNPSPSPHPNQASAEVTADLVQAQQQAAARMMEQARMCSTVG